MKSSNRKPVERTRHSVTITERLRSYINLPRLGFSRASSLLKSGEVSLRLSVKFPAWESNSLCLRPLFDSSLGPLSLIGANNGGGLTLFRDRLLPLTTNGGGDAGDDGPHGLGGDLQSMLSLFCILLRWGSILDRTAKSLHNNNRVCSIAAFRLQHCRSISGGVGFRVQFAIEYFSSFAKCLSVRRSAIS